MDIATLARYFLFFIICSFVGWVIEEIVVAIQTKSLQNRGFLIGPILPIYGFGALCAVIFLPAVATLPLLVFVASALGAGALEYFSSFYMEKAFGARWWDYSNRRFNIHGRVCLAYILAFGFTGLLVIYIVWPPLRDFLFSLHESLVYVLSSIFLILLLADFFTSFHIIKDFKKITRSEPTDDTEDITTHVRQVLSEKGRLHRRLNAFDFVIYRPMTLYYQDFTDDFVESYKQDYRLPAHYSWIRQHSLPVLYFCGFVWARLHRLCHGIKYENAKILKDKKIKGRYFIYANHTQPLSDILNPVDYCWPHRIRLLAAPANLAIPVIGPLLPDLGALPVPSEIHDFVKLEAAIKYYSKLNQPIIIYPEAHVWPWYTGIRPLPTAAFSYPVRSNVPVFTATTIYKKRQLSGLKPRMIVHFDGPFYPDSTISRRLATVRLHDQVEETLTKNAKKSNFKYINYRKSRKKA